MPRQMLAKKLRARRAERRRAAGWTPDLSLNASAPTLALPLAIGIEFGVIPAVRAPASRRSRRLPAGSGSPLEMTTAYGRRRFTRSFMWRFWPAAERAPAVGCPASTHSTRAKGRRSHRGHRARWERRVPARSPLRRSEALAAFGAAKGGKLACFGRAGGNNLAPTGQGANSPATAPRLPRSRDAVASPQPNPP